MSSNYRTWMGLSENIIILPEESPMSEPTQARQGEPHEDDNLVSRIEIEFGIPTFLPQGFMQDLHALLSAAVKLKRNQPVDGVHWVSGYGSKPMWSQADARFLGKTPADDAPASGEPRFDDSVYHVETTARPLTEREKARKANAK